MPLFHQQRPEIGPMVPLPQLYGERLGQIAVRTAGIVGLVGAAAGSFVLEGWTAANGLILHQNAETSLLSAAVILGASAVSTAAAVAGHYLTD